MTGIWLGYLKQNAKLYGWITISGVVGFLLTITSALPSFLLSLFWPIVVIGIGNLKSTLLSRIFVWGDPSYGIYIYGFFIQQLLIYVGIRELYLHLSLALAISILFGYASWHFVEKKALTLKNKTLIRSFYGAP